MKFSLDSITQGLNDFLGNVSNGTNIPSFQNSSQFVENQYAEKGFYTISSFNDIEVRKMKTLWQQPTATVIVKKKMFSSLAEYNKSEYLDPDQKLFLLCAKRLFSNKCAQIAYVEQLTKVEAVANSTGGLNDLLLPVVIGALDSIYGFTSDTSALGSALAPLKKTVDLIKRAVFFNNPYPYTTWIMENAGASSNLLTQAFSNETGVMELTNIKSLDTSTSLEFTSGSASIDFADPYGLSTITQEDIELAMSDTCSASGLNPINSSFFNFSVQQTLGMINTLSGNLNSVRAARNASTIVFKQYPNAVGKKIFAFLSSNNQEIFFDASPDLAILNIGTDITIDSRFVQSPTNTANDALTPGELNLFSAIVRNIQNNINTQNNFQSAQVSRNAAGNYLRNEMYLNFLGKHIIQNNDVVSIFINSRTKYDSVIDNSIQGTFDMLNWSSQMQQTVSSLDNGFNAIFNPSSNINLNLERDIYASPSFPSYLWLMFRNYFVESKDGVSVFTGLASIPESSSSPRSYSFRVSVNPQSEYFNQGEISFNPGTSTENGALLDPLTPYKTKYNQIYSNYSNDLPLLDENIRRLNKGILRHKQGPANGQLANQKNIAIDVKNITPDSETTILSGQSQRTKTAYSPDGLVYQWKKGIGTRVQFGTSITQDPSSAGDINTFKDPFVGQNIFNALSLLITGKPYNYLEYYEASLDGSTGKIAPYLQYLQNQLTRNNTIWGNFRPYKTFNNNEAQTRDLVLSKMSIQKKYNDINNLFTQYTNTQVSSILQQSTNAQDASLAAQLVNMRTNLTNQIQQQTQSIIDSLKNSKNMILNGNDISVSNKDPDPNVTKMLRRKVNEYTRRLPWKVRANEDVNLFIVEDLFDKDQDILSFVQDIGDKVDYYSSSFMTVTDKIQEVANILELEIFCDTQGHIRLRVPQYNKIPSSVFFKMLQNKQQNGIQIYPQFLEDMIVNKITYFSQAIEVEEDFIRFLCVILGYNTDEDCKNFFTQGAISSKFDSVTFSFLSTEPNIPNNMTSTLYDISSIIKNGVTSADMLSQFSSKIQTVDALAKQKNLFDISQQSTVITRFFTNPSTSTFTPSDFNNPRLSAIEQHLLSKAGKTINLDDYLNNASNGNSILTISKGVGINYVKVVSEIAQHIASRQKNIDSLNSALKNIRDAYAVNGGSNSLSGGTSSSFNGDTNTQLNILFQKTNNADIPEVFENMIEDENYDDLGPGSGTRYVIEEEHIKNLSVRETAPEFTYISVQGLIDGFDSLSFDSGNYTLAGNGNSMTIAEAVDYDMWHMYGFKQPASVKKPFFSDAQKHCAPYAAMLLNKARMNVLRGSVEVVGNEYYQPGDVVYIKSRNLLFYVVEVIHNFEFSGSFSTRLQLSYGHAPGQYIPNPFDVIGKMMYNNQYDDSFVNYREDNSNDEIAVGALFNIMSNDDLYSEYSENNKKVLNQLLQQAALFTNRSNLGDDTQVIIPRVELRCYTDSKLTSPIQSNASSQTFAQSIYNYITGSSISLPFTQDKENTNLYLPILDPVVNKPTVNIVTVDFSDTTNTKSISKYAAEIASNLENSVIPLPGITPETYLGNQDSVKSVNKAPDKSTQDQYYDKFKLSLIYWVVDVFVTFESQSVNALEQNGT